MGVDQLVIGGRARVDFFLRRLRKAGQSSRMPDRMLDGEILDQRLELVRQRVIGCPHVGELGVAALRWDFMAQQQRISRAVGVKRHIRVPEPVALAEQHAAVVRLHDVAVGVEVADVDQGRVVDALLVAR